MFVPESLPAPVPAVLAQVASWTEQATTATSAEERAAWLVGLRTLIDSAEAVFTHTLAVFDAHGDGQTLHAASSTASWLRVGCDWPPATPPVGSGSPANPQPANQ